VLSTRVLPTRALSTGVAAGWRLDASLAARQF